MYIRLVHRRRSDLPFAGGVLKLQSMHSFINLVLSMLEFEDVLLN